MKEIEERRLQIAEYVRAQEGAMNDNKKREYGLGSEPGRRKYDPFAFFLKMKARGRLNTQSMEDDLYTEQQKEFFRKLVKEEKQ